MTQFEYEREQTGDRICDTGRETRSVQARAKKKDKYTGGWPVLGYSVNREKRKLEIIPEEARLVRRIFKRFLETGSKQLIRELNASGKVTKKFVTKKGKEIGG